MKKYYAVRKGRTPGIYFTWDDCKKMVIGFKGAIYKSFETMEEAQDFMKDTLSDEVKGEIKGEINDEHDNSKNCCVCDSSQAAALPDIYAFVDGSFNQSTKTYGYGGFLLVNSQKYILQGSGKDEEMAGMRNVAGEILGSRAAVEKALELGLDEVSIFYDYMGIEMWAKGMWKRNKKGTMEYYEFMQSVKDKINVHFVKVKGHSGVEGNEEADKLAKMAVGIGE